MGNFAVLNSDSEVENLILADTKETAEEITGKQCVEYKDPRSVKINWSWDGEKFISPDGIKTVVPFSSDEDFIVLDTVEEVA